jgi:DNA-binding winged helix-turn-helix (wHTH) protein/Tfp pilus assembly protein PilF
MNGVFKFADFELDCRSSELRKRGRPLRVQQQVLRILATLVSASGTIVTRERLRDRVWGPGADVDFDRGINKAVTRLRQLLGDSAARPRFIETLPKRGYRFVAPVTRTSTENAIGEEARELYLKARHFWNRRTPDDLRRSVEYFRCTIERDPDSPLAWSGLAEAHVMIGIMGLAPPHDVFPAARAAAERALALDASSAAAYAVVADVEKCYEWSWDAAERSYRRAIELDPQYAVAHQWFAQLLSILGRHHEARAEMDAAHRCDPLSISIAAFFSYVALEARAYDVAVAAANQALELDPNAALSRYVLGRAYLKVGEMGRALAELETAARLAGDGSLFQAYLGYACARAGDRTRAEQILAALRSRRHMEYVSPVDIALICLGLRDADGAIASLEEAYETRAARTMIAGDPFFAELASDSRYRALLARLGLPLQMC